VRSAPDYLSSSNYFSPDPTVSVAAKVHAREYLSDFGIELE
jgi:hypothetical protein